MPRIFVFVLALFFPLYLLAQESFVISDIRLEGLQRVAPATVFSALNVSVGDQVSQADITGIIRNIFATNNFDNVEVLTDGNVLIIRLEERPTISSIEIEGNSLLPTEALRENMEGAGIAVGQTYQPSVVTAMQMAVEDQYVGQGLYGASVEVDIEELERNRVALNLNINEGDASKIVHINIVGNAVFSDEELLDLFELKTRHWLSFIRKDDRYSREKINGDLERLASYYMDQGYINFNVLSTQVSVSPAKDEIYITINISEGDVYTVSDVQLAGDLVDLEPLLNLVVQMREGQTFSQQLVTTSAEFISQVLNSRGYFFAEAEGVPQINEDDKTVSVTFFVEPGDRTYVNRINFYGNTNSVDEVLRREMRQMEGAPASTVALEQSKVRLERLGYFRDVEYETTEVPGTTDQIDVDFSVEEQLSGSISGSIGYAQVQGLILSADLQQNNFLGTGTRVGVGVNTSRFSTSYNFSFFDPYYTIDGVSRGFSLSYVKSDFAKLNLAAYSTNQINANINYGYLISETQQLSFSFGFSNTDIDVNPGVVQEIMGSPTLIPGVNEYIVTPPRLEPYTNPDTNEVFPITEAVTAPISDLPASAFNTTTGFVDRQGSKFNNFTVGISWNESTLNRGVFPTAGSAQNLSLELSVPGSDLQYYRIRYFAETYIPLFRSQNWVVHARANLGYGAGYGGESELPFFMNFYAGGLGTIRGFERNTLGPRATYAQRYEVFQNTRFLRDDEGNILLNADGTPRFDSASPPAYSLTPVRDAEGNIIIDDTGLPVYEERLGRSDPAQFGNIPAPFGGNIQTTGTIELLFPLPFLEDRSQVRSSFFIDGGNVFSSYCTGAQTRLNNCNDFDFGQFRYSAGVSVTWLSGFGPMSFSLSKPFNASEIDETEIFQFSIGNTF